MGAFNGNFKCKKCKSIFEGVEAGIFCDNEPGRGKVRSKGEMEQCRSCGNTKGVIWQNNKHAPGDIAHNLNGVLKCCRCLAEIDLGICPKCEVNGHKVAEPFTDRQAQFRACYIATCVYNSYDCPEVWVLRRYRDYGLANRRSGRAFTRFYYAAVPLTVRLFGRRKWFNGFWKKRLDRKVLKLKKQGFSDEPYDDLPSPCRKS